MCVCVCASSCAGADTDRWTSDLPADMSTNTHTSRLLYALMRCRSLTAADWACGVWNHQSTSLETHTPADTHAHTERVWLKIACMQTRSSTTSLFSQTPELASNIVSVLRINYILLLWCATLGSYAKRRQFYQRASAHRVLHTDGWSAQRRDAVTGSQEHNPAGCRVGSNYPMLAITSRSGAEPVLLSE